MAWFAGLFDGEGTIGFYQATCKGRTSYQKFIGICINDTTMLQRARVIIGTLMDRKSIPIEIDRRNDQRHPHTYYRLYVRRTKDLYTLLKAITPYLVGKKAQALLMIQLIENHKPYKAYSDGELAVIEALKLLKRSGFGNPVLSSEAQASDKCVEAIHGTSNEDDEMVRPYEKSYE